MSRAGGLNQQGSTWPTLTGEQAERVEANVALVHWALRRRGLIGDEYDDRAQDGMLGLVRAAQLFDPTLGYTFATYAMFWIRQAIVRGRDVEGGLNRRVALRDGIDWAQEVRLDAPAAGGSISDFLAADDDPAEHVAASATVEALLAECVNDHERAILIAMAAGETMASLARRWGVNNAAVRQRQLRLIARLRGVAHRFREAA